MGELPLNTQTDEISFEKLFKTYYSFVVRRIMKFISSQTVAEDIAQEVFLKLYHIDRKEIENIPAWLTKVAINQSYNYLRSEIRRKKRMEKEQYTSNPSSSPENKWIKREEKEHIRSLLSQMDERERNLLLMKYSGFTYEELASVLEIKKESVGTLLSRAKQKFKKLYHTARGDTDEL